MDRHKGSEIKMNTTDGQKRLEREMYIRIRDAETNEIWKEKVHIWTKIVALKERIQQRKHYPPSI